MAALQFKLHSNSNRLGLVIYVSGLLAIFVIQTNISDLQEGLTMPSKICDSWWQSKLVTVKCGQVMSLWSSQGQHHVAEGRA